MAFDKFLIAPLNTGLQRDVKPWLIPDDAFEVLNNAYIFRGRLEKRLGAREVPLVDAEIATRLRMKIGTTDGAGNLDWTTAPLPIATGSIGQMFSCGTDLNTLAPATFTVVDDTPGAQDMITTSTTATVATFDASNARYVINTAPAATDVYFYPALPVMGFTQYERSEVNDEHTYAWDTRFCYRLLLTGWDAITPAAPAAQWSQSNFDFFWSENWRGINDYSYLLFTTNGTSADAIRFYDGATWTLFQPQYASNANELILGCKLIVSFQNRLLFLNTIEQDAGAATNTITNRCRYSRVGSPIDAPLANTTAWREDLDGEGSFIDAPTREAIVSCAKIKNRLIVFFERSTYELVYTGNQVYPFRWQELNSELGCESTFSFVPFDKVVLGIGQTGIHACNGANVERIDSKIPDEVFEIHNHDQGPMRVHGIKDYYNEMVYWSVPGQWNEKNVFPNRLLIYNYKNDSWAFWDDNVTAFGYHQLEGNLTWAERNLTWAQAGEQWNDGQLLDKFNIVIAGNQEGYTWLMERGKHTNSASKQITDIQLNVAGTPVFRVMDHNLSPGDWVRIENCLSIDLGPPIVVTEMECNDKHYKVDVTTQNEFSLEGLQFNPDLTLPYSGNGVVILLSRAEILSKRFNFYTQQGVNTNIEKTDFLVDKNFTSYEDPVTHEQVIVPGELTVDYLTGSSWLSLRDEGVASGAILGNAILEMNPYTDMENVQKRFWHAVYLQAQGESVQLKLYWKDEQMTDTRIPTLDFTIGGILFHASPTQEL